MHFPAMVMLFFHSLHAYNLSVNVTLTKQTFYKIETFCLLNSDTHALNVLSSTECALHCLSFSLPSCDVFIWNIVNRTCIIVQGTDSLAESSVTMTTNSLIYYVYKEGCTEFGYCYDSTSNTCLKIYEDNIGKTWKEARTLCQQKGGDLISITTQAKWSFTVKFTYCVWEMWIGLKAGEWLTGEPFFNLYGTTTQLNNYDEGYTLDSEQHCGLLRYKAQISLRDESCNLRLKNKYLCEILIQ